MTATRLSCRRLPGYRPGGEEIAFSDPSVRRYDCGLPPGDSERARDRNNETRTAQAQLNATDGTTTAPTKRIHRFGFFLRLTCFVTVLIVLTVGVSMWIAFGLKRASLEKSLKNE